MAWTHVQYLGITDHLMVFYGIQLFKLWGIFDIQARHIFYTLTNNTSSEYIIIGSVLKYNRVIYESR